MRLQAFGGNLDAEALAAALASDTDASAALLMQALASLPQVGAVSLQCLVARVETLATVLCRSCCRAVQPLERCPCGYQRSMRAVLPLACHYTCLRKLPVNAPWYFDDCRRTSSG